ncbi:O-antigen ligase family protein [Altericroceibacterium endophyticum]|uniref:O-antigen ligase-related domain-containing protein n=1 Tax=Altericroceibacterium endophyticum TaxID=1808508 RepID=A0A6I4SZV7_9SPHN|nr:O-antigen ligase family protein [Altericroceibacterium endophyticum]MXO64156.1 hypothetical protein [Altericroceibacterium endophyticum]
MNKAFSRFQGANNPAAASLNPLRSIVQGPSLVLTGLLLIVSLAPPELSFGICCLISCGLAISAKTRPAVFLLLLPTALLIPLGLIVTASGDLDSLVVILRSFFYIAFPLILLTTGLLLSAHIPRSEVYFRAIIQAGVILALFYICKAITADPEISATRADFRETIGHGYAVCAIAAALCIARFPAVQSPKASAILTLLLTAGSLLLSGSRAHLLTLGVLAALLLFWCAGKWRNIALGLGSAGFLFLLTTPAVQDIGGVHSATPKHQHAVLGELQPTSYSSRREIQQNWRGFETALSFDFVVSEGISAQLFGLGWGKEVPLLMSIKLGAERQRAIGKFHNIYSHLMVRGGLTGLLLYALQIALLCALFGWRIVREDQSSSLGFALLIAAVLAGPTIGGLYAIGSTGGVFALLIGALAGSKMQHVSVTFTPPHPHNLAGYRYRSRSAAKGTDT